MRTLPIALAVIAVFSVFAAVGNSVAGGEAVRNSKTEYSPQTSDEHGVKVTVTLRGISEEAAGTWDFQVVLETHTRDLDEDLVKSSVLIAESRQYSALSWEGTPGGHHRTGVLRFREIDPRPPFVELRIRLSGETSPRSFRWQLK